MRGFQTALLIAIRSLPVDKVHWITPPQITQHRLTLAGLRAELGPGYDIQEDDRSEPPHSPAWTFWAVRRLPQ